MIPATQRPDGSWRKARKIRTGFNPSSGGATRYVPPPFRNGGGGGDDAEDEVALIADGQHARTLGDVADAHGRFLKAALFLLASKTKINTSSPTTRKKDSPQPPPPKATRIDKRGHGEQEGEGEKRDVKSVTDAPPVPSSTITQKKKEEKKREGDVNERKNNNVNRSSGHGDSCCCCPSSPLSLLSCCIRAAASHEAKELLGCNVVDGGLIELSPESSVKILKSKNSDKNTGSNGNNNNSNGNSINNNSSNNNSNTNNNNNSNNDNNNNNGLGSRRSDDRNAGADREQRSNNTYENSDRWWAGLRQAKQGWSRQKEARKKEDRGSWIGLELPLRLSDVGYADGQMAIINFLRGAVDNQKMDSKVKEGVTLAVLVFGRELSKRDRAGLHSQAEKVGGVASSSHGVGEERFLTLTCGLGDYAGGGELQLTPEKADLARRLFKLAQLEYHSRYECLSHREIRQAISQGGPDPQNHPDLFKLLEKDGHNGWGDSPQKETETTTHAKNKKKQAESPECLYGKKGTPKISDGKAAKGSAKKNAPKRDKNPHGGNNNTVPARISESGINSTNVAASKQNEGKKGGLATVRDVPESAGLCCGECLLEEEALATSDQGEEGGEVVNSTERVDFLPRPKCPW